MTHLKKKDKNQIHPEYILSKQVTLGNGIGYV